MLLLTAEAGGTGLIDAVNTLKDISISFVSFMMSEPLVYFLAAGIGSIAIGLFARAKHAAS